MENGYQERRNAQNYLDFLDSVNGKIQRELLLSAISARLPGSPEAVILDAGCASGWLASEIKKCRPKTYGCDASEYFINLAKTRYPEVEFSKTDLTARLPYPPDFFDAVILNMAAPDISDLVAALKNLGAIIKPGGKLLMTIPNPYCTFPVAVWKRTLFDVLLRRKPRLKINSPYFGPKKIHREFGDGIVIDSNFYSLGEYFSSSKAAGFKLTGLTELKSQTDSNKFDLNYQMFRYPLILIMEFDKS